MQKNDSLYRLLITAILLAVGMVLPFLTGQLQSFGQLISPLHIPVFICGLTCGWGWGAALGFILPILRGLIFGMPPFPAVGLPMAFEMLFYGLVTGLLYPRLLKVFRSNHIIAMLIAMVVAMIVGRCAGGAAKALMIGLQNHRATLLAAMESSSTEAAVTAVATNNAELQTYTFAMFISAYFIGTAVGAVIHLVVCPYITTILEQAKLSPITRNHATT